MAKRFSYSVTKIDSKHLGIFFQELITSVYLLQN